MTDARVVAGRVGRPHGLDGSFHVIDAVPDLLEPGRAVTLAGRVAMIERRTGTAARPLVRVSGCDDRDSAKALHGEPLVVRATDAPPLGGDEWYAHELEGCEVRDGDGLVGVVSRLIGLPSCEALVVERAGGGELLVPLVRDAVRSVEVGARTIDVDMGFVEGP